MTEPATKPTKQDQVRNIIRSAVRDELKALKESAPKPKEPTKTNDTNNGGGNTRGSGSGSEPTKRDPKPATPNSPPGSEGKERSDEQRPSFFRRLFY